MQRRAEAADSDRQPIGLLLGQCDECGKVIRRQVGIADQKAWHARDHSDRREIGHRIERQLGIERRIDCMTAEAHQKRVAVRERLGHRLGGEIAAGARPIFDHDRLPQGRLHRLRDRARHRVRGAAGRCADQELDRPRRIIVGLQRWRRRQQHAADADDMECATCGRLNRLTRHSVSRLRAIPACRSNR